VAEVPLGSRGEVGKSMEHVIYPLVMTHIAIEYDTFIVDLPTK